MNLFQETKIYSFKGIKRAALALFGLFILSACGAVSTPAPVEFADDVANFTRVEESCKQLVNQQQAALESASNPQYILLANTALSCINNISFSPKHPDIKVAMQFNALSVVNFIKAGDISRASESLSQFKLRFPQRDLLFSDFTSFVDTATLLTKGDQVSQHQLALLNISPQLKSEIKRQRQWALR